MIPDRSQYFLEHFWIDQNAHQIWTLGARMYYQNTQTKQEKMGTSLNIIIFCKYGNKQSDCFENV